MLGQRRRQWTNIVPTLGRYLVFAGLLTKLDVMISYTLSEIQFISDHLHDSGIILFCEGER